MFLYGESRETMLHVAGLLPFTPAPGSSPDHLRELVDEMREGIAVHRPWNLRLRTPDFLKNPLHAWVEDEVDLEYHVRRSALPSPGDERELGILVSRLHGGAIDFHRPPWEVHLIEGLERGRFALYVKVHHALVDGFTSMKILVNALSFDPAERRPLFFAIPPKPRALRPRPEETDAPADATEDAGALDLAALMAIVREQYGAARTALGALRDVFESARTTHELVSPREAPRCVLNTRISRSRRFATARLPAARVKALAKRAGGTINDLVLAISASCLRRYLLEHDALPAEPLIAMLPVAVRTQDDEGGGNAVGAILATLATDEPDPAVRIRRIIESTAHAKRQLQGMSKSAVLQYSALLLAPAMLQMIPGAAGRVRPTFNVVISNVPGPDRPLYFRGAELEAAYPMSVPVHGQALNITCNSYAGQLCFGFTGCRDTVPHLQRLAVYAGLALDELEAALA